MENNENANGELLKTKSEFDISDSAFDRLIIFEYLNLMISNYELIELFCSF